MTLIMFVMEPEMETQRTNHLDDDGQLDGDGTCSMDRLKQNMANS